MSTKRVLISMPDRMLNKLDLYAKHESRSRSEFIREAVRIYIQQLEMIPINISS